jgi:serine/threonine protein kinase
VTTKRWYYDCEQPQSFGVTKKHDPNDDSVQLLSFVGQGRIISVPYIKGSHCPTNTKQLACIAEQIRDMHHHKWKHADLRLCNMVFDGDQGHLIDFDFSGHGNVKYPQGFVKNLFDAGSLRPGKELEIVSAYDDAKTFCMILDKFTNRTNRRAFSSVIESIDDHLQTFKARVKSFRATHEYQSTEYNEKVDDFECGQSVLFLNETIKILKSAVIYLEFKNEEIQEKLETHVAIKREKAETMEGDTRTPPRKTGKL